METVFLLDRVVQDLEQNPNLARIKKLIICACRNTWENDPDYLKQFALGPLIQELVLLYPTLEELRQSLDGIVRTLNKTAEYTLVANAILDATRLLYPGADAGSADGDSEYLDTLYNEIAQDLEQDENADRIKKLIFCVCGHSWENEIAKIDRFKLATLVQTLHEINPTFQDLDTAFSKVVRTLNKQVEYGLIADEILDRFERLYPDDLNSTEVILSTDPQLIAPSPRAVPLPPPPAKPPAVHPPIPERFAGLEQPVDWSEPSAHEAEVEAEFEFDRSEAEPESLSPQSPPPQLSSPFCDRDPFEIRLEAIRYANPLRIKILTFSALHHPFAFSDQDWLDLRSHQLDDLLQQLVLACKTVDELEAMLDRIARTFDEAEEYLQVTTALLRVLRPLYLASLES